LEVGDVRACDVGPLARRGIAVVPVGESSDAGGIHDGLQSEKHDAVGGDRNRGTKKDEQSNDHLE